MNQIEDFRFALNISAEGYEKKTDASACLSSAGAKAIGRKKMCFFEMNLTVSDSKMVKNTGTRIGKVEST